MPAANYNAAVLANGAAGENVMLLTARWDETILIFKEVLSQ